MDMYFGRQYSLATTGHKRGRSFGTSAHPEPPRSGYSLATSGHREPPPRGGPSLLTTGCPRPGEAPCRIAQAFDTNELDEACHEPHVSGIVHHGAAVELAGFDLVHSHVELLAVFSGPRRSLESISLSRCIDGLRRGFDAGDSSRPILRHRGRLNRRALRFALEQVGVKIGEPEAERSFHSYGALATAGCSAPGSMMIGLRGKNLRRPGIFPVRLQGFCPLATSTHNRYPLQYDVHYYVRRHQPAAWREFALGYLAIIRARMALDRDVFSPNGGEIHLLH